MAGGGRARPERVLAAVRHPACRVLGHPTGRLLLARPGYEVVGTLDDVGFKDGRYWSTTVMQKRLH